MSSSHPSFSSSHHYSPPPRRQRRRARERHPPELIHVPAALGGQDENDDEPTEEQEQQQQHVWTAAASQQPSRVRLVLSSSSSSAPPPPIEPPPVPSQLVGIAVLGESQAGKTSIVRRFVHRTTITTMEEEEKATNKKRGNNNNKSSVDYYKKDLSFWYNSTTVSCARIQVWDITTSCSSNSQSSAQDERANIALLLQRRRTKAIVLVQSLEYGLDHVVQQAHVWKDHLLSALMEEQQHNKPAVYWFLHKSDLLFQPDADEQKDAALYWIHVGSTLQQVATNVLGVTDWFLTSCKTDDKHGDDSIERAFMKMIRAQVDVVVVPGKVPTTVLSSSSADASSSWSSSSSAAAVVK